MIGPSTFTSRATLLRGEVVAAAVVAAGAVVATNAVAAAVVVAARRSGRGVDQGSAAAVLQLHLHGTVGEEDATNAMRAEDAGSHRVVEAAALLTEGRADELRR